MNWNVTFAVVFVPVKNTELGLYTDSVSITESPARAGSMNPSANNHAFATFTPNGFDTASCSAEIDACAYTGVADGAVEYRIENTSPATSRPFSSVSRSMLTRRFPGITEAGPIESVISSAGFSNRA